MSPELEEAADRVVRRAGVRGASEVEVVAVDGDHLEVGVRLGRVEKLKRAREHRVAVRAFVGEASAVCSTADIRASALDDLLDECIAMAKVTASDPFAGLPALQATPPDADALDLYDPDVERFDATDAIRLCRAAEESALAVDPRLTNSEGAECGAGSRTVVYATSLGARGGYRTSSFSLSVVPVARSGDGMQRDFWYSSARHLEDLEPPDLVGRHAAERTLRRLGARSVKTSRVPVVFDGETARSFLGHFAAAVSGTSVYRGTSFLRGRLGERLAPDCVRVVDDPFRPRGLGSRPFDAEGLASRRNVVFGDGRLASYLLDTYSARKLGMESTASAVRSLGEVPSAGASNLFLEPGAASVEEILRSVRSGFYVTELIGSGVNPVTGDYSRGAAGMWIENGELAHAVEGVTIAGNLLDMLRDVEIVGSDLEFRSAIASPTLKIATMTVAGAA